jgi:hypothetical protein
MLARTRHNRSKLYAAALIRCHITDIIALQCGAKSPVHMILWAI